MKSAYIAASYRTPSCRARKGKLKNVRPDDLAATVIRAIVDRTAIDPAGIDDVILGCAFPEGEQGMNVGRVAAMKAGLPYQVPGQTINRFCSSGLQSIAMAAERILCGFADCILAGGVESMSAVPLGGLKYSANPGLMNEWPESYASMGITAETVAKRYGISRDRMDMFAVASHQKAAAAQKQGTFDSEIIPVTIEQCRYQEGRQQVSLEQVGADDGVRPDTSLESLAKLAPVFCKNGSVTAGNSSQTSDGAAVTMVVSEDFLRKSHLVPIARFVGYSVKGVPPEVMGIGPVEALPAALAMAGLKLDEIGLIELNEAFASQAVAVADNLHLDMERVNVNGGAIALGHPLGCTGAKLTSTLLHEMRRQKIRYGMVSMCIGGGMGAAGIFERL